MLRAAHQPGPQAFSNASAATTASPASWPTSSIVMAMGKNQLDQSVQNEVVAILYSLKGDVVRR